MNFFFPHFFSFCELKINSFFAISHYKILFIPFFVCKMKWKFKFREFLLFFFKVTFFYIFFAGGGTEILSRNHWRKNYCMKVIGKEGRKKKSKKKFIQWHAYDWMNGFIGCINNFLPLYFSASIHTQRILYSFHGYLLRFSSLWW